MAEAFVDLVDRNERVDGRKLKPPDRKKYEEDCDTISAKIKSKEAEYKALNIRPEESITAELREFRAEKEITVGRRRQIDNELRDVNQQISKQMEALTKIGANLQYKKEDRINEAIRRLEHQLKNNNFKLREEKKIVAEIDRMHRSKKALGQFNALKQEIDGLRDIQRRKREERDRLYKTVTILRTKEEELKKKTLLNHGKEEAIKKEIDELYESRRQFVAEFKRTEREYYEVRNESRRLQRDELFRKREEEKRQLREEHQKELEEYEALREPYEDEKQLCMMLVSYLQRHLSVLEPGTVSGSSDTLSDGSPRPSEQGSVEDSIPQQTDTAKELETEGMYVLRKKDEELFGGISRHKPNKRSKRDKRKSVNKPVVHTPEIFTQFASLNLSAPSTVTEIPLTIEQLHEKKAYYDSLPAVVKPTIQVGSASQETTPEGSGGAPSYTESTISESIPSTPEVTSDNPPAWPRRKLSRDSGLCELEGPNEDFGSAGEEGLILLPVPTHQTSLDPGQTVRLKSTSEQSLCNMGTDCVTRQIENLHLPPKVLCHPTPPDGEGQTPSHSFVLNSLTAEGPGDDSGDQHSHTDRHEESMVS